MLPVDLDQTPRQPSAIKPRRKGPPSFLRIDTPVQKPAIALFLQDPSTLATSDTLSSANSESDSSSPFSLPSKQRTMRNTKKLSLTLPSAHSNQSSNSLSLFSDATSDEPAPIIVPRRKASIVSIPAPSVSSRMHRKDEDDPVSDSYKDGPVCILPGIWLGNEDNAVNWKGLTDRGIRAILNVAREVASPFDQCKADESGTFYSAQDGKPDMHYLKLPWSHGQPDLIKDGFVTAMGFVDAALNRGDGVLIHCQCGVSRSATVAIALVMRAAVQPSPSIPSDVHALKGTGFSGAYDYVKGKSSCIGPNMLLIYQLQDYSQVLSGVTKSPSASERSSVNSEDEEEWSRRRRLLDEEPADPEGDFESIEAREAYALDRAMEERVVARKTSGSSLGSTSGIGMGPAWKARYGNRKRNGSINSNFSGSIISEDLVEEDEKEELLGVGGGFDAPSISSRSHSGGESTEEEANVSPDCTRSDKPLSSAPVFARPTARQFRSQKEFPEVPPSAPATKVSFGFVPRPHPTHRTKARPPPLTVLPPVPSSPDILVETNSPVPSPKAESSRHRPPPLSLNKRSGSTRIMETEHARPKSLLLNSNSRTSSRSSNLSHLSQCSSQTSLNTPSQTLFVFPPSPTLRVKTPHMVTVTSSQNSIPFPSIQTPRVSSFKPSGGHRKYFISLAVPPTPTTACTHANAHGFFDSGA